MTTDRDAELASAVAAIPGVGAVSLGGSRAMGLDDASSDSDLYAFHRGAPGTPEQRHEALTAVADAGLVAESTAWGLENHFTAGGHRVEIMYLDLDDVAATTDRAYGEGLFQEGYTTAFLHTIATSRVLLDDGSLAPLRKRLTTYPEATHARILAQAEEFLAGETSYVEQLTKAQRRGDLTGVAHRLGKLVDVWFDVLFALNRRLHPGEKRLLVHAASLPTAPADCVPRWEAALRRPLDDPALAAEVATLTDELMALARA